MSDDRISVILEAVDQASGPLQGLANNITDMASRGAGAIGGVATALTGVGVIAGGAALAGVLALGKAGVDAWGEMDTAADTLMQKTGASGEVLDGMTQSVMGLRASAAGLGEDTSTIAETMATLSQRTGATGSDLEALTSQTLEFSKIMGGDAQASAMSFSRVLAGFNVPAEEGAGAMDKIFVAARKFGVQGDALLGTLDKFGPTLRQMGLGIEESAVLIGGMSKAGIDADGAMAAVTRSAAKFAKEGVSIQDGLRGAITAIQGATSDTEAMAIAAETFGGRAAGKMVDGIRNGKISLDDLTGALGDTTGALDQATEAALDAPDRWAMGMTQIQNALVPVGEAVMELAAEIMPMVSEVITTTVVPALRNLGAWLKDNLPGAIATMKDVWNGLQPAFQAVMAFVTGTVVPALATLGAWLKDNLPGAIATLVSFWQGTLWPALQTVGAWVQGTLVPILSDLFTWIATNLPPAIQTLADFWNTKLKPALEAVWAFIKDPLAPLLKTLVEIVGTTLKIAVEVLLAVWDKLQPALKVVGDYISATFDGLLTGIKTTFENLRGPIGWVNDRLNEFKQALSGLSLPEWLQRRSPSPIEQTFSGLADVTPQATQTLQAFGAAAGTLSGASLNVAAVQALAEAMRMLVSIMGAPGMGVEPGSNDEERINTMSSALGQIASAVKATIDTMKQLVALGAGGLEQFLNGSGRDWVVALYDAVARLGRDMAQAAGRAQATLSEGTLENLKAVASLLQTTNGIIKSVVDAVNAVLSKETRAVEATLNDPAARDWVTALVYGLTYWGARLAEAAAQVRTVISAQALPQLRAVDDALSAVTGILAGVVDAVNAVLSKETRAVEATLNDPAARDWVTALVYGLTYWGARLAEAATQVQTTLSEETAPALRLVNDALGALTGVLTSTITLVQKFLELDRKGFPVLGQPGAVPGLTQFVRGIVALASGLIADIQGAVHAIDEDVIPNLSNLGDAIGSLSNVMSGVIDVIRLYFDTLYGDDQWARWTDEALYSTTIQMFIKAWVKRLIDFGEALRVAAEIALDVVDTEMMANFNAAKENLSNLGDILSGLTGVMSGVIDVIRLYFDTLYGDDQWARWTDEALYSTTIQMFIKAWVKRLIDFGEELRIAATAAIDSINRDGIESLTNLGDSLSALSSATSGALDVFRSYMTGVEDGVQWDDTEVRAAVGRMVGVLVAFGLELRAEGLRALTDANAATLEAIPVMASLGTALSDLSSATSGALDVFRSYMAGVEDGVQWDDTEVRATVGRMVGVLVAFGLELHSAARAALAAQSVTDLEAMPALAKLARSLNDLVGVLRNTLDIGTISKEIAAYRPQSVGGVLSARLQSVIADAVAMGRAFAQQAAGTGITEAWQDAASALAGVLGDAVGAIRDALDVGALLSNPTLAIPSPAQVRDKMTAILRLVDEAVNAFSAQAVKDQAGGVDVAGLTAYAGAVKGVFEAIGEIASAINSYSSINVGKQFAGVESVGFGNISGALRMIWALFEDAAQHHDLVLSVVSTLTTALDGVTALATAKGADAGNAWLAGFQGAIGGGALAAGAAPGGAGAGAQVITNYITNNTKTMTATINASTSEAGRGAVMSTFSMVMY